MSWHPLMIRLGKSVEELARETVEEILGFDPLQEESYLPGQSAHKPARADIQKLQDVYRLYNAAHPQGIQDLTQDEHDQAYNEWQADYTLDHREKMIVQMYQHLFQRGATHGDPEKAFQFVVDTLVENDTIDPDDNPSTVYQNAKREIGGALKKYEQSLYPQFYTAIVRALKDLEREHPESYKLWPWAVKQMRAEFQDRMQSGNVSKVGTGGLRFGHLVDIVGEGGALLNRLRAENRIPQNLDVNRLSFGEFENWLMQWKRDNREAEAQGEVVYKYDDGWTMQKLTTPEQLQFEGDEMGHCVGGYAHVVGSGQDIIYSLRDPKGTPHVTMEIEGLEALKQIGDKPLGAYEPEDVHKLDLGHNPDPAIFMHNPNNYDENQAQVRSTGQTEKWPFQHVMLTPHDDPKGYWSRRNTLTNGVHHVGPMERMFKIVQIMGQGNKTPKPEYQHKVKEFLDYLRSKGWKFERSDDWYAPHDQQYGRDEYEDSIREAQDLDQWYDNAYKSEHEIYRGVNSEDAYGLPRERMKIGIGDWDELFKDCFRSLLDDYDPGRWRGNWRDLAQAVYHAWFIDIYKDHLDPEGLEKHRKNLVEELQSAEETLNEWNDENWYYAEEHMKDEIAEEIKKEAEERGELQKIETALDEEHGEDMWDDDELVEWVRENDEDLYYAGTDKARDQATDYFAGDAYKFVQYIIYLAEKFGGLNPQDLPNPNDRHGGLPSFEDLEQMPWKPDPAQKQQTPVEEGLPGALSHTASDIEEWGEPESSVPRFQPGERVVFRSSQGSGTVIGEPEIFEGGWWYRVTTDDGRTVQAPEEAMLRPDDYDQPGESTMEDWFGITPEGEDYFRTSANEYQIYPIDHEHNVWFDEDGNQHTRYRPKWIKNPITDEWLQSADELEDTFLDKQGRQGQGWVAYHGENPIGSLTYVADPAGWNMLGTTYVHPDHRQQGLFNRMVAPLREEGKPIDAYVWNNPWLKQKVRSWTWG